jgi:endonuclease/exonuclease/phosphatase (EEP) superfamily protein YafD
MPGASLLTEGWYCRLARVIVWCGWLYLAGVLAAWALLSLADLWWPATLLLFSPRWLLALPAVPLLALAVFLRRRAVAPLLVTLAVVIGPVMGFCVPWQRLWSDPPRGQHFRILTCNVHYQQQDWPLLDDLITETGPDIIVLQEWRGRSHSEVLSQPQWYVGRTYNQCLASKHRIRQATRMGGSSTGDTGSVMRYELETPVGVITLFSLHFASPREGLRNVVHGREEAAEDVDAGSELRWKQSEKLAQQVQNVTGPVLLAGDFNTPPESAIFRRLWSKYTDAFGSAGWGWGYTFQGGRTLVRIDHILAGPGWHCDRCWVGPDVGSPHRPVLADVTWPQP